MTRFSGSVHPVHDTKMSLPPGPWVTRYRVRCSQGDVTVVTRSVALGANGPSIFNDNRLNLFITYKYDSQTVEFLDVLLHKDEKGEVQTNIFRKPTSTNMLLHATSSHPGYMIQSVPTGQFLRLRRLCSSDVEFIKQADDLKLRLKERGFSNRMIKKAFNRARYASRNTLLYGPKQMSKSGQDLVRFVTDYHSQFAQMRRILNKSWHILRVDPVISRFVPEKAAIAARRSRNLRDRLVHSHYTGMPSNTFLDQVTVRNGCFPCGRCVACTNFERADKFDNQDGSHTFSVKKRITCNSRYVIYYAICPCRKIYIGMTTRPLKNSHQGTCSGYCGCGNGGGRYGIKNHPSSF
ncbi:unnamed protein product [Ranitomeya imitator]|uniref:Helix-turn-helix domain-containing protein n=1 Tax=Ranitomeya imitator TaxID=111125 RepID=A0ABN9M7R2_9NEOB|nr:unnamed protein product [Ranitomeya imitator]